MDYSSSRSFQVIVYQEKIFELFAALARIFMHGYTDHNCILDQWMQRAVFRNVLMECGPTATSIFKILQFLGIPCRIVGLNCHNNKYCGHVINEVFVNNQWILVDFDRKVFVVDAKNQYLSLKDIILHNGFYSSKLKPMCEGSVSSSGMAYGTTQRGYLQNNGFLAEFYSLDFPKNLKDWYDSYNVFMNSENPVYEMFVCDDAQNPFKNHPLMQDKRQKSYYKVLSKEEFLTKFYGEDNANPY
ncbi:transglutaminase domain-containing protein [Helicobacter mesocricetorum]|uniref:transglutaminase domain-containing protein n=1 Tax=Helicobacter mesocricetorum TaxID=87012 RepID=UPI000CF0998B|nr:hypothetical protein [Helicobacter mesocricetorum]